MKKLELKNTYFTQQLTIYKNWLETVGYAQATVYGSPLYLKEFFFFLEAKQITTGFEINQTHIELFFEELKQRTNQRREGGLSQNSIHKYIGTMSRYSKFFKEHYEFQIPIQLPKYEKIETVIKPLSVAQIGSLFDTCEEDILGIRDKAMLALYYSCGLRKSEGMRLNLEDINLNSRQIHIKQTKTGIQRMVVISKKSVRIIENYLYNSRELLLNSENSDSAFLISSKGQRVRPETIVYRLKRLAKNCKKVKQNEVSLHLLRHSIATHLLQAGMELENISLFLGHQSLDSTQIYTHLVERFDT